MFDRQDGCGRPAEYRRGQPQEAIERARPALEIVGAKVWPAGEDAERANVIKLATHTMLVAAVETMGEAASMTAKYGVEPGDFLHIITQSVFACPAYMGYAPAMKARDYDNPEGFKLALGAKDMDLALAAAGAENVPMPMGAAARQQLSEAMAAGSGGQDLSALAEVSRRGAHLDDEPANGRWAIGALFLRQYRRVGIGWRLYRAPTANRPGSYEVL